MTTAQETRFKVGDQVRVLVGNPPNHFRTPAYVQGKSGRVVALCGIFPNPESLGHGGDGLPAKPLYRVEFPQETLWQGYKGPPGDRLLVDIYEHWLEPAS